MRFTSKVLRRITSALPILIATWNHPATASIILLDGLGFSNVHANGGADFSYNPPASGTLFASSITAVPATAYSIYQTSTAGFDFSFLADAGAIADPADPFGDPSYANAILSLWFTIDAPRDTLLDYRLTASDMSCSDGGSAYFSFTSGMHTRDWSTCDAGERTGQFLVTPGGQALSIFYSLAALDTGSNGSLALARFQLQLSLSAVQPPVSGSVQEPPVHMPEPGSVFLVAAAGLYAAGRWLHGRRSARL